MKPATFIDQAVIEWLPDKRRLHMRHGPIDLVLEAVGEKSEVTRAYEQAAKRFLTILEEVAGELDLLQQSLDDIPIPSKALRHPVGQVASHMQQTAYRFYNKQFITPMICVAGAVADHVLASMMMGTNLSKAYVNNGGDIALHLTEGQHFDVGVCSNPLTGSLTSKATIVSDSGVGGIATSGWRGRSYSLGIADAVTVLARDAATADAAATLIANAIDLPNHPAIERTQADQLLPNSDLGELLVTTSVNELLSDEVELALLNGKQLARQMINQGLMIAVYASLQSEEFSLTTIDPIKEMIHA